MSKVSKVKKIYRNNKMLGNKLNIILSGVTSDDEIMDHSAN